MRILLIILAVLALICLIRVHVTMTYGQGGASVKLRVGFIRYVVFPRAPKAPKKKRVKEKKKKEKKEKPPEEAGGTVQKFKGYLDLVTDVAKRLRRALRIDLLRIHYTVGGTDAAETAMSYGKACAWIAALLPGLHALFRIKKQDIRVDADFNARRGSVFVEGTISMRIWEIIYIGLRFFMKFMRQGQKTTNTKMEQKKGGV